MGTEIIQVELIEPFVSKIIIPILVALIPSSIVSVAFFFVVRKLRIKDVIYLEKTKKELELNFDLYKKSITLIEELEKILYQFHVKQFDKYINRIDKQVDKIVEFCRPYELTFPPKFELQIFHLQQCIDAFIIDKVRKGSADELEVRDGIREICVLYQNLKEQLRNTLLEI